MTSLSVLVKRLDAVHGVWGIRAEIGDKHYSSVQVVVWKYDENIGQKVAAIMGDIPYKVRLRIYTPEAREALNHAILESWRSRKVFRHGPVWVSHPDQQSVT